MAEKDEGAEGTTEKNQDVAENDSPATDPIGEKSEDASVWSGTEELTAKSVPNETDGEAAVENVADISGSVDGEEAAKEETPSDADSKTGDVKAEDIPATEPDGEDEGEEGESKPDVEPKPGILIKILSPLLKMGFVAKFLPVEKLENVVNKIDGIVSGIKGKAAPIINIAGVIKSKVPLIKNRNIIGVIKGLWIKDRDIIGVLKNPWIIANGIILVVALSMTVVIVLWFKTSANKINVALTDFAQLQLEARNDAVGLGVDKNDEGAHKKEVPDVNEEFGSFLESAEQWYGRGEYEEALAFYKALVSVDSDIEDESFLDLRIGECYFHLGLYKKAIESFNNVLFAKAGSRENKWHSQYMVAECFMKVGDFNKGRRLLYKLVAISGDFLPETADLVERSYYRIANSYLEEAQLRLVINN